MFIYLDSGARPRNDKGGNAGIKFLSTCHPVPQGPARTCPRGMVMTTGPRFIDVPRIRAGFIYLDSGVKPRNDKGGNVGIKLLKLPKVKISL